MSQKHILMQTVGIYPTCLEAIHEKYMDSLKKIVDMQREFGFIGEKENEDNEK